MKKITLTKLNILDDAKYPQREEYPDGYFVDGYMNESYKPTVGEVFYVLESKLSPKFCTSTVTEILSEGKDGIMFKTRNSTYKITYND